MVYELDIYTFLQWRLQSSMTELTKHTENIYLDLLVCPESQY